MTTWIDVRELPEASDAEPPLGGSYDDPLALYYTSGTTGLPKAVVHTHASSLATAQIWLDVPRGPDAVFGTGAIIWGIGFPAIVGPALYAGMRLVLEQDWGGRRTSCGWSRASASRTCRRSRRSTRRCWPRPRTRAWTCRRSG
ncbi:AMP-binding protein [Nonomuraea salmonea]|uniref:AMP-binding protein n=1 Tax=Nonomuraea salmonea TaxID=46181 RepID=UPI0031E7AC3C